MDGNLAMQNIQQYDSDSQFNDAYDNHIKIIESQLARYGLKKEHIFHGTDAIPAALNRAMDLWADKQALAFGSYLREIPNQELVRYDIQHFYHEFIEYQKSINK